jgi:hypothetical protein
LTILSSGLNGNKGESKSVASVASKPAVLTNNAAQAAPLQKNKPESTKKTEKDKNNVQKKKKKQGKKTKSTKPSGKGKVAKNDKQKKSKTKKNKKKEKGDKNKKQKKKTGAKGKAKKKSKGKGKANKKTKGKGKANKKTKGKGKANKKTKGNGKAKKKTSVQQKGKQGKSGNKGDRQAGCLASNCLDLAVSYISLLRNKVTNFQNQNNRMARQNATVQAKVGKKMAFMNSLNQLITAGGGNMSSLVCSKNGTNPGEPPSLIVSTNHLIAYVQTCLGGRFRSAFRLRIRYFFGLSNPDPTVLV